MRSVWMLVVFLLAVIAVVFLLLTRNSSSLSSGPASPAVAPTAIADLDSTGAGTSRVAAPPLASEAPAPAPTSDGRQTSSAIAPTAPDRERDLHGLVLGPREEPIAGAHLDVRRCEGREIGALDVEEYTHERTVTSTATNAAGEFSIALAPGVPHDLHVEADGFAPESYASRYAGERVIVHLHPAGALFGHVTRATDGSPVEKARVTLLRRTHGDSTFETRSDSNGEYRLEALPPGSYQLQVEPEADSMPLWIGLSLGPGEVARRDVVVKAGRTISGIVTDATTGQPIAGAVVSEGWTFEKTTKTSDSGEYVLRGFTVDWSQDVHARAKGFGRLEKSLPEDAGDNVRIDFELSPGRRARGRVLEPGGTPISGAYVAAVGSEFQDTTQMADWIASRSREDGSFDLWELRPDVRHALLVSKEGFGRVVYDFPTSETASAVIELGDVFLKGPSGIAGLVVDDTGQGVSDVEVSAKGWNEDRFRLSQKTEHPVAEYYVDHKSGRTDDLGRFRFTDLSAGSYEVSARIPGLPSKIRTDVTLRNGEVRRDVRLVVPSGESIDGTVTDPDGKPQSEVFVELMPELPERGATSSLSTGPDGKFHFGGLRAGSYRITARRWWPGNPEDLRVSTAKRGSIAAGTSSLIIALPRAATISGSVVDTTGSPVADAFVLAIDADHDQVDSSDTDPQGRFSVDVPEGSVVTLEAGRRVRSPTGSSTYAKDPGAAILNVAAGTTAVVIRLDG